MTAALASSALIVWAAAVVVWAALRFVRWIESQQDRPQA